MHTLKQAKPKLARSSHKNRHWRPDSFGRTFPEMGLGHYYFPFSWLTTVRHFISCPISSPDTMNLQITQTFARDVHLLFRSTPDQIMKFVTCMILRLSGELIVNLCFCHLYFQLSIANTSYIAKTTPENKNLYKIP
jgi:hypothetical protein